MTKKVVTPRKKRSAKAQLEEYASRYRNVLSEMAKLEKRMAPVLKKLEPLEEEMDALKEEQAALRIAFRDTMLQAKISRTIHDHVAVELLAPSKHVAILDINELPPEYVKKQADKAALMRALKALEPGQVIPGAKLMDGEYSVKITTE